MPIRIDTASAEPEDLLRRHHLIFHARDFSDARNPARAVGQPRHLNHQMQGRRNLFPDRARRQRGAGEQHHRFDSGQRVTWRVGVNRGQRALVTGVHRLQHIERLTGTHFTDDDPIRTHAQRVLDQIACEYFTAAFRVRRPGFEAHHMRLLQTQLGGIFDGDDAFVAWNECRQRVQHRRLSRTGAAGDEDIQSRYDAGGEKSQHLLRHRAIFHQRIGTDGGTEPPDRQHRTVERQRRNDGVYTRAVSQTSVHHRRRLIHAAPDVAHDAIDDRQQMRVVAKHDRRALKLSLLLDID